MRFTKRIIAFALVALTVCACFAFGVSADTEEKKPLWVTHFNNSTVEGAGVIFTDSAAYQNCGWWLHISFAPTSEEGVYEVKEISDGTGDGKAKILAMPEGGFVYAVNYGNNWPAAGKPDQPNYVTEACSGCIDGLKASVQVGQKYHFYGLDLENKTVPTTTSDKNWYDEGYVCTAEYALCTGEHGTPAPTPVKETITVDGNVDDNGWKADGWKEVTPETGRWQTEPQTEDTLSYRYQLRADDEYLYVAVEAACKSVDGGNGNGTNLRFWINSDPEATIYTHFYDVFTQGGETKVLAKRNTSKTENKGENIENSTIEAKYVGGEEKVVIEFKVKLSEFNGGEGFKYFICVSNKVNENICLYNAQLPITDADRLANFPYKLWNKETETSVTVADIKLGEIGGDPQPPVDDDPDKKYIEEIIASVGEKNPDGQFDLVIEAPEEYKAGDEITVNVKIKNIKVEEGIVSLLADFYYDNEKLTLLNTADEDGAIECITLPDSWENLVKQDKDEQHNVIDNGHITLAVLTGKKKPVKDDDSLTFTFKFKVKEDAKNAIGFYIPHESVTAKKYDLTDVLGNGGYAITKMHVEGGTSSSSSTAQTGDGSTSMIVFAIVALVAICGSAVVIKSRK